ncbi:unnamed protein product [Lactuca virosa]|uniref:Reticulon domain-containing protein n=1 Tax=Lactuca virosa TaxID=75947 RepID=A0AAU9LLZ4_9ASTR|nr:unnamed protein product [Lactuca virosa]
MDSPPPYTTPQSAPQTRTKSASRLARTSGQEPPPILSLDLVSYYPRTLFLQNPKPLFPFTTSSSFPLPPPRDQKPDSMSPRRNTRRSRRRTEEIREDRDLIAIDESIVVNNKPKKRRHSGRSKKEKSISCPSIPSPKGNDEDYGYNFDRIGFLINDLIMWNDVAKSTLWFGFGSLCFLSSCFTTGISFSMLSLISHLGLLCLGVSFFSNSIARSSESKRKLKLKEDDILKAARVILPALNLVISKAREVFSGEPSMTLKHHFLLLGSDYGHILTLKRLCALGFFIGFTGPKLYSLYSIQIHKKSECVKGWILEAWRGCSHKKVVAGSVVTVFWNLTSIKTRIFAAFICVVIFRRYRQQLPWKEEGQQPEKTLTLVETKKVE